MLRFHPIIQTVYNDVQEWLSSLDLLPDYRKNNARDRVNRLLRTASLESAALQHYVYFPGHCAKVIFGLQNSIDHTTIAGALEYNDSVTVIDVGCGAGAATNAFIDYLLKLKDAGHLDLPLKVHFIGIDPNEFAIAIYYQTMERLKNAVHDYDIHVTHEHIADGDLQAVNKLGLSLANQKAIMDVPYLGHVFLFQANVVSPFNTRFQENQQKRENLLALGVPNSALAKSQESFGQEEAIAYKHILENCSVDNLHVITVGTRGLEERVHELTTAIDSEFEGNSHLVTRGTSGEFSEFYEIPERCYWRERKATQDWEIKFSVAASSIASVSLSDDDWNQVQSMKNLQTAWARARHHLLSLTLVDEVEIRLFEVQLGANLTRIQQKLVAYARSVVNSDDRLQFKFPKSQGQVRPMGLSRIEEEILSTALIQKLGQRIAGITSNSYAYNFSKTYGDNPTEYLYENWYDAYGRYISDARYAAQNSEGCSILQVDIRSFYTRIVRDSLIELSTEQLTKSKRVEWLVRALFDKDIDDHELGKGIIQGSIASGFFANLYLVDVDARFGLGNEWDVNYFRYVDDIILIIPDPVVIDDVIIELDARLDELGLELNSKKTERFDTVEEFLASTEKDETLDGIQTEFEDWINCLWIMTSQHLNIFRKAYTESQAEWWYRIETYQKCLESINIYIDVGLLSRRIYKYLFNENLCSRDLNWKEPFDLPELPTQQDEESIANWKHEFEEENKAWAAKHEVLHNNLFELLTTSQRQLSEAQANDEAQLEKVLTRTVRFCCNKLIQMDLDDSSVSDVILALLTDCPWLIRNPHKLMEHLAKRGKTDAIKSLLERYSDETDTMNEYLKSAALRVVRFLPSVTSEIWDIVADSAVSESDVTSLMATETWIRLESQHEHLISEEHVSNISLAINRNPMPISRLLKNYILILKRHEQKVEIVIEPDNTLVQSSVDIEQVDLLFEYYEPAILTREYYSGYREDDGYYNPSSP